MVNMQNLLLSMVICMYRTWDFAWRPMFILYICSKINGFEMDPTTSYQMDPTSSYRQKSMWKHNKIEFSKDIS